MITNAAKRIRLNECAELPTRTSLIWMRFGTNDHIFNIHDVQLIIILISLCGVNKKWRKITTTTKNQIQSWPFISKPGEHRQQSKGEKNIQNYEPNEFDRMRVKQFLSETVAMHPQYWSRVVQVSSTNPIPYASDTMVGRCRSTMRRLDNLKSHVFLLSWILRKIWRESKKQTNQRKPFY